jgi:hypothetical protein
VAKLSEIKKHLFSILQELAADEGADIDMERMALVIHRAGLQVAFFDFPFELYALTSLLSRHKTK